MKTLTKDKSTTQTYNEDEDILLIQARWSPSTRIVKIWEFSVVAHFPASIGFVVYKSFKTIFLLTVLLNLWFFV